MGNGKERRGKLDQTLIGPVIKKILNLLNIYPVRDIPKISEDWRNLHFNHFLVKNIPYGRIEFVT